MFYSYILVLVLFLFSCGTAGKLFTILDPNPIDKEELIATAEFKTTTINGIQYDFTEDVDQDEEFWSNQIDGQLQEYLECMQDLGKFNEIDLNRILNTKIIIVRDGKFECPFHFNRCSGEYDAGLGAVFVSRKIEFSGFLPLLKHEWGHVGRTLDSEHKNIGETEVCF